MENGRPASEAPSGAYAQGGTWAWDHTRLRAGAHLAVTVRGIMLLADPASHFYLLATRHARRVLHVRTGIADEHAPVRNTSRP